jgi:hypothetical protein
MNKLNFIKTNKRKNTPQLTGSQLNNNEGTPSLLLTFHLKLTKSNHFKETSKPKHQLIYPVSTSSFSDTPRQH